MTREVTREVTYLTGIDLHHTPINRYSYSCPYLICMFPHSDRVLLRKDRLQYNTESVTRTVGDNRLMLLLIFLRN